MVPADFICFCSEDGGSNFLRNIVHFANVSDDTQEDVTVIKTPRVVT
jgi:hypothetical protein